MCRATWSPRPRSNNSSTAGSTSECCGPPVNQAGLAVETIRNERVIALLASRHPATTKQQVALGDLCDDWFISYPDQPPSTMYTIMIAACRTAGFTPRIRQTVADSAALVALVAADMGVAIVPASLGHLKINGATFRPISTPRLNLDPQNRWGCDLDS